MALRLKCTMCGANIVADDLAIRHELVACTHCSTVLRITQKGLEEYTAALLERDEPSGISIKREGPGQLLISALRNQSAAAVINRREVVQGIKIGLIAAAGISVAASLIFWLLKFLLPFADRNLPNPIPLFCLLIIPAVIIAIFVAGKRQKSLPPLRLTADLIQPSVLGSDPVATENVQQLYTAVTNIRVGGRDQSLVSGMVYALTQDGDRIPLIGPLNSQEAALHIEETLEVEMGIFNLPVYGEADMPAHAAQVRPDSAAITPLKGLQCQSCAAELNETPESRRRGYLVCDYCEVVMLLYEPGSSKPILGIPDPNSPTFQYRIETRPDGLAIFARQTDSDTAVVELAKGQLQFTGTVGSARSIDTAQIVDLHVKETVVAQKGKVDPASIITSFGKAMAHSGEVDPQQVVRRAMGLIAFKVVVKGVDGHEDDLLDQIREPQEAFLLVSALKERLENGSR